MSVLPIGDDIYLPTVYIIGLVMGVALDLAITARKTLSKYIRVKL